VDAGASDVVDVALLSAGGTLGWQRADEAFAGLVRAAGATCAVVKVTSGKANLLRRHPALTDLVAALSARHSAGRLPRARAIVISTVTASLFVRPRVPYAIRFDATADLNRPGLGGVWQRVIEPGALARASLLLPWSDEAAAHVRPDGTPVVPLPVPVEEIAAAAERDVDVLAYAGNPHKRGLEVLCAAWASADAPGRLVIGGIEPAEGRRWLARCGVPEPAGVEWAGIVPRSRWLELLGRARVFASASRYEDHGLAPLEALSAGALLVTVSSPGPYPGLAIARALGPELVAESPSALASALQAGLAMPDADRRTYTARAHEALRPHRPGPIGDTVANRVLPALGLG
jgi:Glycosyl transferases group 1